MYSAQGLLELAATGAPITAGQIAEAADTPRGRAELREAVQEVDTLRRGGANKAARDLAKELAIGFVVIEDADNVDVIGVLGSAPEAEEPEDTSPAALASSILDRHRQ
jgi:hypothetical protein